MSPARKAPKWGPHGEKHGLTRLKAAVKDLGGRSIDRRTTVGRALAAFRPELVDAMGGPAEISPQQEAVIELTVRTKLMVDSVDAWVMTQPSLVNRRTRALLPVVRERQALVDSLARLLGQLGLHRRAKPVPTLAAILARAADRTDPPTGRSAPLKPAIKLERCAPLGTATEPADRTAAVAGGDRAPTPDDVCAIDPVAVTEDAG